MSFTTNILGQKPIQFLIILLVTGLFTAFSYMSAVSASLTSSMTNTVPLFVIMMLVWIFGGNHK